jgi:hypothetical protein
MFGLDRLHPNHKEPSEVFKSQPLGLLKTQSLRK